MSNYNGSKNLKNCEFSTMVNINKNYRICFYYPIKTKSLSIFY